MFNSENSNDNEETGFADAYKSQILNRDDDDDKSSKNLIIILALIALILALSIFGYIYMSNSLIKEKEVKSVEPTHQEVVEPPKSQMLNNIDDLIMEEGATDEVVEEIEQEEDKNKTQVKESKKHGSKYLEQLAKLSSEIDGDKKR